MTSEIHFSVYGIDGFALFTVGVFALVILLYVTVVFLIAQLKRDNSVMDIFYGPAFAVGAWTTLFILDALSLPAVLMATLTTVWATRLSLRILRKNWGRPEDPRYAAWRLAWTERGNWYFVVRSYLQINLLQGVIIVLVSLPTILVIAASLNSATLLFSVWTYIGMAVWAVGLMIETIADWQLDCFIERKKAGTEPATLMTQGLFHYARRPNYFGESLIWWGLAIIAVPFTYGYLAFIAPLLITFILTRVTGPMLEDIFLEKYPETYRQYMATTSYFIPWFKKTRE